MGEESFFTRSLSYFQKVVRASGPAAAASYTLIGAIIFFGAIGLLFDKKFGTSPVLLLLGILLGLIVGFYELAKLVWRPPK